jgi:hypothetical protein
LRTRAVVLRTKQNQDTVRSIWSVLLHLRKRRFIMEDIRILTNDEVFAVPGGTTSQGGGGGLPGPHPQPSPIDVIVREILKLIS